jgi:hypothetical protein
MNLWGIREWRSRVRPLRVVRSFLMLPRVVMLSSFSVVLGSLGAVFGCFSMMFGGFFDMGVSSLVFCPSWALLLPNRAEIVSFR